jgi:hypothetical protein
MLISGGIMAVLRVFKILQGHFLHTINSLIGHRRKSTRCSLCAKLTCKKLVGLTAQSVKIKLIALSVRQASQIKKASVFVREIVSSVLSALSSPIIFRSASNVLLTASNAKTNRLV